MSLRRYQHLGGLDIEGLQDRDSQRQGVVVWSVLRSLDMAGMMAPAAGGTLVGMTLHSEDECLLLLAVNVQCICLGYLFHASAQTQDRRQGKIPAADMRGGTNLG